VFWKKDNYKKKLKDAPGPSPWYIRAFPPKIKGLKWEDAPDDKDCSGITTLRNSSGDLLALFDFCNYILPLQSGELLIWHQPYQSNSPTNDINCVIFNPENLLPLDNELVPLCKQLRESKTSSLLKCNQKEVFQIPTNVPSEEPIHFDFPCQLDFKEILILCHSSGIDNSNNFKNANVGILVAVPKENFYTIFPQVWFNEGGLDYGYQWITRVARGQDGKVYGEGIRISPFRLDKSMKNIEKTYK
jgi:hypothetical protein